jgi:hypothetical protein
LEPPPMRLMSSLKLFGSMAMCEFRGIVTGDFAKA